MSFHRHVHEKETFTPRKILVVDDDPASCNILTIIFRSRGYQTTSLNSGREVLNRIGHINPDVILLDVMMPGMDGWETFQRLRDRSSAPVLFLTALDSGEFAARAFALGANDFVRKPFYTEELLAAR